MPSLKERMERRADDGGGMLLDSKGCRAVLALYAAAKERRTGKHECWDQYLNSVQTGGSFDASNCPQCQSEEAIDAAIADMEAGQ